MLRTRKQRQTLCRECPVARAADLVGDSVSLIIVRDLLGGPKRFGELAQTLCVSSRTLTLKLRVLQRRGIVTRRALTYSLTPRGKALRPVVGALRRYGEKYL